MSVDLLVRAGKLFSGTGFLEDRSVGITDGRIATVGADVQEAGQVLDFPNGLLVPGLVDLHAHPACSGSKYGIDPDLHLLPRSVTTVMSQGDAGAAGLSDYQAHTIQASQTRVLLALNLSRSGETREGGCLESLAEADVTACVEAVRSSPEGIWGLSVNTSRMSCGETDPCEILSRGLDAAEQTGLPILFGSRRHSDCALGSQLSRLREGDVLTYCFHGMSEGLLDGGGKVRTEVREARERGILFDVGHGIASFSFDVAEACVSQGFFPDTISSDQYIRHVGSKPPHDLARTASKLIAAGMPETEALRSVTARPAEVLGMVGEIGVLAPGACADLAVLAWKDQAGPLVDSDGRTRPGGCWEPVLTVRAGTVVSSVDR